MSKREEGKAKIRNFVKKHCDEFCKPVVHRDRKKNPSKKQRAQELAEQYERHDKAKLHPYKRESVKPPHVWIDDENDDERS